MTKIQTIQHSLKLDLSSSHVKKTVIKQSSKNAHVLNIELYSNNNRITIDTSWDIKISTVKKDNHYVLSSSNISVSNNVISVIVTEQMVSCPGDEKCEIIITDGDHVLISSTFLLYIDPNVNDGSAIESSDDFNSIERVLAKIQGYEQEAKSIKDSIEEIYKTSPFEIVSKTQPSDQVVGGFWLKIVD